MILLIDVGGTRIKWATWDGEFRFGGAEVHGDKPLQFFLEREWLQVSAVWISLVPRVRDIPGWTAGVQQKLGMAPQFAASQAQWKDLRIAYPKPEGYGVDRWLGLVALRSAGVGPFLLASAGTALTMDRVDAQGQHLGGVTAAGFGSMQRALLHATRTAVEGVVRHDYGPKLGRDPVAAILQGAYFSAMGVIQGCVNASSAIPGEQRILTGGDAPALLPLLGPGWEHRPYLVLQGLLALAQAGSE